MKTLLKALSILCVCTVLLTIIIIPASAMTIYDGSFGYEIDAFLRKAQLVSYTGQDKYVVIPDSFRGYPVTEITKSAFSGNTALEEVSIPSSVTKIENEAFRGCTSLRSMVIPETVTDLGRGVFTDCIMLSQVTIDAAISILPADSFAGCTSLSDISLSNTITTIGNAAFAKCTSIQDLSFLGNVNRIADSAFYGNGFTDIEIPAGISSIPYYAFAFSETLNYVTIPRTVEYIHPNAFTGSQNVVIKCYYDTCGYEYAIEQNIPYILLDNTILGDADGDGSVNVSDVTKIQRYLAELETLEGIYLHAADANQDGTVDIADATIIQMYLAEYEMDYPIGEVMTQ